MVDLMSLGPSNDSWRFKSRTDWRKATAFTRSPPRQSAPTRPALGSELRPPTKSAQCPLCLRYRPNSGHFARSAMCQPRKLNGLPIASGNASFAIRAPLETKNGIHSANPFSRRSPSGTKRDTSSLLALSYRALDWQVCSGGRTSAYGGE
jgi:hypothetical protein